MTAMPWENDPIVGSSQEAMPWENDPIISAGEQESPGMMPFVNRAIAGTVGAPVDMTRRALNLIPGVDLPEPFGGRKSIERGMEAIGIPVSERGPETLPEYIGTGIGEVSGMLVPGGLGMKTLAKGPGLVGKITNSIWQSMTKHPWLAMTSEITAGAGAGTGRATDSPTAELAGGVAGGMVPGLITLMPSLLGLRLGKTLLRKFSMPFTKTGAKWRAGKFVKGQVVEPAKTGVVVGKETIGDLPPAVQSGEKKLVALYKSLVGQDPVQDAETIETLSKSIIKLEGKMRKLGYGSPEVLAEITRKRVAALELGMDKRVADAMGNAQRRLDALPVARRKGAESVIVRNELKTAMRAEKAAERRLWKGVPKDYGVGFEKTRQIYVAIVKDLAKAQRVDIPSTLKTSPIIKSKKIEATTLREMQGLRSKLLETARRARKEGQWNKARIAENVSDAILDDLGIAAGTATTPEAASLQSAIAATKQFKTQFESGVVGKILGYSKSGAPAIDPSLTLDISIGRMAQKGAVDINKIAITPEAVQASRRYLTRSYTDYALDRTTGTINSLKSDRWIKTNEAILDQFPSLRNQLADASKAQELAVSTRTAMKTRKQALRDPRISTSARFLNAADMNTEITSVLKSNNPPGMANQLVRQARKDPSGEALEGLRGGFVDHILEKSSIGSFNELGEQTLSGRTLLNFVKRNDATLRQVFTPEQIGRMKKVGAELGKIEKFEKMKAGKPEIEMKDFASSALRLFSRFGGARLGGWMGSSGAMPSPGGSLQMAQIMSGRFRNFVTRLTRDKAEQMVHDAILSKDPKLLQALLLPIDKPGPATKANLRILNERMNLWLAGTGKRVIEDIEMEESPEKNPMPPLNSLPDESPEITKEGVISEIEKQYRQGELNEKQLEAFNELRRRGKL